MIGRISSIAASLFGSIAVLAGGCVSLRSLDEESKSDLTQSEEGSIPVGPSHCPIHSCGNAATVLGTYIAALDTRRIEPQPESTIMIYSRVWGAGGGCWFQAADLQVQNGEFVGVMNGQRRCGGADMVGATFNLSIMDPETGALKVATILIAARDTVGTVDGPSELLPTYRLIMAQSYGFPLPPNTGSDLCPTAPWTSEMTTPTSHALLVQGEVYDRSAKVIVSGSHWFNLACAGSALAKMRLHGMDPMKNRNAAGPPAAPGYSTVQQRQSALKLLTAKYCGDTSWTVNGTPIFWRSPGAGVPASDTPSNALLPGRDGVGPIESRWGSNGALCISHLRRCVAEGCTPSSEQAEVEQIQRDCNIPSCDKSAPCPEDGASMDSTTLWWTCTANHIAHGPP